MIEIVQNNFKEGGRRTKEQHQKRDGIPGSKRGAVVKGPR